MKKYSFLLLLPLFVLNCARQTAPTGGPKDTIPPVLIRSTPNNGATQVKETSLNLIFNEAVALQNPKEQIIIIPTIGKEYEITAKKNQVNIKLNTKLQDSTTYSLTFREAIVDITEKNEPPNLKLAFSTGNYIDSISLSGITTDLLLNKELKDVTIALYQSDTFNIFKHKPIYISQSNEKGKFSLTNLKNGEYYVYAFTDKNKNLITDSKTESYGFLKNKLSLDKNIDTLTINLIRLDTRPLKLTSARPYNTYFNIKTTKQLTTYTLKSNGYRLQHSFGEDNSIIKVYKTFEEDSIQIHLTGVDSALNKMDTTIFAKFTDRKATPEKFTVTSKQTNLSLTKATLETILSYTKPLAYINFDSILFKIDSLNTITFTEQDCNIDSINKTITIIKKIDRPLLEPKQEEKKSSQDLSNQLHFGTGAFISIENDSSTTQTENIKLLTPETTGVIIVNIKTSVPNYVIQLKDKTFNTIRSSTNTSNIRWEDIPPSEYQIIMIIDEDGNGKWSPGNKLLNIEPEKIVYYTNEKKLSTVNLKPNWELGPLLINYK